MKLIYLLLLLPVFAIADNIYVNPGDSFKTLKCSGIQPVYNSEINTLELFKVRILPENKTVDYVKIRFIGNRYFIEDVHR